ARTMRTLRTKGLDNEPISFMSSNRKEACPNLDITTWPQPYWWLFISKWRGRAGTSTRPTEYSTTIAAERTYFRRSKCSRQNGGGQRWRIPALHTYQQGEPFASTLEWRVAPRRVGPNGKLSTCLLAPRMRS